MSCPLNFSDPGVGGDLTFYVDWRDGSAVQVLTPTDQTSPLIVDHVFLDNQPGETLISVTAE